MQTVVGTRPQLLKAQVLGFPILHTGQHYDPALVEGDYHENLNLQTSDVKILRKDLRAWIKRNKPDKIITIGDTNTALAAAIAAYDEKVYLIHQEAGPRCGSPTYEERNRIEIDNLANENWAPSINSMRNLIKEGLQGIYTGDPLLNLFEDTTPEPVHIDQPFSLVTMHRQETVDVEDIFKAWCTHVPIGAILPRHPRLKWKTKFQEIPPVTHAKMIWLIKNADHVYTDSGGVQREAMWSGTPFTVLREQTEWLEGDEFKRFQL